MPIAAADAAARTAASVNPSSNPATCAAEPPPSAPVRAEAIGITTASPRAVPIWALVASSPDARP